MESLLRELQKELGDRYEVLHEIGRGGMAVVFLAADLRHARRRVALKVLRPDLGFSTDDQRFLQEIETIASLDHPHIIPMYDSGKAGNALFYVMPFVEGESLRQRLEREGALPLDEAVRICREVADALDYAHALGVVHRDIKPENILLSAGHARVTDFGIARAISAAGAKLTDTGLAVGTPAYMSPEQALADPHLDGRSDQYALGCVVYETLAGVPPFQGSDSRALMARHTSDAVPPLTTVRSVSPRLDEAVRRALAKQRADRWPSAGAFAAALSDALPTPARSRSDARGRGRRRSVIAAVGFVAAAAGLSIWLGFQRGAKSDSEDRSSVAVLPATFSGDSAGALFADGLTEAIITGLVRVPGIRIPASSRVAPLSGTQLEPRDAGRSLGVQSVVTTAVQVAANRLRVTAQLVRVSDGTILWREAFDGELESHGLLADVFPIYDDLASKLVSAVAPHLAPSARNVAARGLRATDPEAYQYFLRARRLNLSAGSLGPASDALSIADSTIVLLREAIRRDTLFSDAWATLADALLWREALAGLPPAGVVTEVSEAVGRALTIDSTSADAYARRAEIYRTHDWDWDRADRDFRRAVQLAPSSAEITGWYAAHLAVAGQVDSAIAIARYALTQDPTNSWLLTSQGMNYAYVGKIDSAYAFSRRAVALDSAQFLAYWVLAHVYLNRGQRAAADNAIENFLRFSARGPDIVAYAAHYYRRSNNTAAVARLRRELTSRSRRQYVPAVNLAVTALAAGDTTEALAALVVAERDRDRYLMTNLAHLLYPLRGKPQYDGLVRRVYGNRRLNTPFR